MKLPGASGGEYAWLQNALTHVTLQHGIDLRGYLIAPAGPDPVKQFLAEQYHARRCALFHAKSTKQGALLPGVANDRREVSEALEPLIRLVLALIRAVHDIIFPSGGMVVGGFTSVIQTLVAFGYEIAVLNDPEPRTDLRKDQLHALGATQLSTTHIGALDAVGLEHGFIAETTGAALRGGAFNTVTSYTTTPIPENVLLAPWTPNGLLSCTLFPDIEPGSATTQLLLRWVLDNLTMPRSRYTL